MKRGWKDEIYFLKPFIKLHLVESKNYEEAHFFAVIR